MSPQEASAAGGAGVFSADRGFHAEGDGFPVAGDFFTQIPQINHIF